MATINSMPPWEQLDLDFKPQNNPEDVQESSEPTLESLSEAELLKRYKEATAKYHPNQEGYDPFIRFFSREKIIAGINDPDKAIEDIRVYDNAEDINDRNPNASRNK